MTVTYTTLLPTTEGVGDLGTYRPADNTAVDFWTWPAAPITGSLSDGSDATFYRLGGSGDETSTTFESNVAEAVFHLPDSFPTPLGVKVQLRARTSPSSLGDSYVAGRTQIALVYEHGDAGPFDDMSISGSGEIAALSVVAVADPTWFDTWYGSGSQAVMAAYVPGAGWWADSSYSRWSHVLAALNGDGFKVSVVPIFHDPTETHRDILDLFELRLVIAHEPVSGRLKRKPLRQFPRSDGLGMSSTRRVDANRSQQATLRRAGGTYI